MEIPPSNAAFCVKGLALNSKKMGMSTLLLFTCITLVARKDANEQPNPSA